LIVTIIVIVGCSSDVYYNQEFYERISGLKIPGSAKVIESIDNGEFVTTTVFKIDSINLQKFITQYKFDTTEKIFPLRLMGNSYLKENKINQEKLNGFYYKAGAKEKNNWLYLVDLKSKKIWAEIGYPDWAGN